MKWLKETIESDLPSRVKEECIDREYRGLYLERLEGLLEAAETGYGGLLGSVAITLALYDEVRTVRTELEAGL
jgi:hypothetical protein